MAWITTRRGVDDRWFDAARKRIYASGSGAIDVFQQDDADHYTVIANITVGASPGSTSLYFKSRTQDGLYVSWPNMLPQGRLGSPALLRQRLKGASAMIRMIILLLNRAVRAAATEPAAI